MKHKLKMEFSGKVFETPIKVKTDIAGGGIFFYIIFKQRLTFKQNGIVELSIVDIEDKWGWKDYHLDTKFVGKMKNPQGSYSTELELKHKSKNITWSICAKLINETQLICSCVSESGNGDFVYFNELYEMVVE